MGEAVACTYLVSSIFFFFLIQDEFILYSFANVGTCSLTETGDLSIHSNTLC